MILRCVFVSSDPYCTTSRSAARTAKGLKRLVELRPGDEDLGLGPTRSDPRAGVRRHIDAFRLAVPDIEPRLPICGEGLAADLDRHGPGRGHDAGLIAGHAVVEDLARA